MKIKHDNKGFTLVELLVAVAVLVIVMMELYAVINNTSKVYQMGNYEVSLQMEAQQSFQLLEELMIDANSKIEYDATNDKLTISGNVIKADGTRGDEYKYEVIYYAAGAIDPETSEVLTYGRVKLLVKGSVAAYDHWETVADYVDSFDVDMSQYTTADKVTLNMRLHNERYSYQASKDVYLRNGIGVSDNHSIADSTDAQYFVDCKRFGVYNLKDVTKEIDNGKTTTYSDFYFEEKKDKSGADRRKTTDYEIDSDGKIKCTSTLNNSLSASKGPIIVIATGGKITDVDGSEVEASDAKISISTDPVGIGANGYGVIMIRCAKTSVEGCSLSQVRGISLGDAKKVEYKITCKWNSSLVGTDAFSTGYSSGEKKKTDKISAVGSDGNSTQPFGWNAGDSWDSNLKKGSKSYKTYGGEIGVFDTESHFFFDVDSNAIGVSSKGWLQADAYKNFLDFTNDKNRLTVTAYVTWDNGGSDVTEAFPMVFFPDKQDGSDYSYISDTQRDFLLPDTL